MNISFLGGADEVGASSILLEIGGRRLLIDAGIRPSPKTHWDLAGDQLPDLSQIERAGGIDAILVTHAHTDHTGALALVCERYPQAPIYATPMTIELTRVLQQDARRIMQARLEEEGELPLFDDVAVSRLLAAFVPVAFRQRVSLAPGLVATFFPAGHIAGAAMIGLESDEGRVLITGDISISPQRTVDGARPPAFAPDVVIIESTYGGRLHANRAAEERRLVATVNEVIATGGKVLIPAFALGRAQEILLTLAEFQRRAELPPIPIWADGMVRAVCRAYARFPEALPTALQARDAQFFNEETIRPIERSAQRNELLWQPEPLVVVASSGMLAGGPSLHYARGLARQPQHAILFTGYQDEESPGRRMQEIAARGHGVLQLRQDRLEVRCRLATYALSAHADEAQLTSLVETLDPAQVFLVHGDEAARRSLANALQSRGRLVHLPRAGQSFDLRFAASLPVAALRGIGADRPLHLRRLWEAVSQAASDAEPVYLTLNELAMAWWGEKAAPQHLQTLGAALAQDSIYFAADPQRAHVFRVRSAGQVQLGERRRQQMAGYTEATGQWLLIKAPDAQPALVRCVGWAPDHLQATPLPDDRARWDDESPLVTIWPEEVVGLLGPGDEPPLSLAAQLAAKLPRTPQAVTLEPNQALVFARTQFPPAARLRKTGYRLAERILVLTFDFPDVAQAAYADQIAAVEKASGWVVEVAPEAQQGALATLATELLPTGWKVVKGPSIHREQRRVGVTVAPAVADDSTAVRQAHRTGPEFVEGLAEVMAARFAEVSGYQLDVTLTAPIEATAPPAQLNSPTSAANLPAGRTSGPLEINAAYAAIRAALADSTLYRVGLRGDDILLSFISATVGERYQTQICELQARIGWKLTINPQPNQGAILEAARLLLEREQLAVLKRPSIYPENQDVCVTLAAPLTPETQARLVDTFAQQTGFRLRIFAPQPIAPAPARPAGSVLQLAPGLIHLTPVQHAVVLNPDKLNKTIERIRRQGIQLPLQVRRTRYGYALVDGLYRLRAAQSLGMTRVPVEILEGAA